MENPLDKPLEFGNLQQINAIKELEKVNFPEGNLYEVEIEFEGIATKWVRAKNAKEAGEIVMDEGLSLDELDGDTRISSVRQLSSEEASKINPKEISSL